MNDKQGQPSAGRQVGTRRSGQVAAISAVAEPDERRSHVIRTAYTVFFGKGYHCARMDDIAAAAGMSKRTIYQMFASKEDLFEALLADRMASPHPCELNPAQPLETAIAELLLDCALWVLSADGVAITRLIMSEYSHGPELGRLLKNQGYKRFMVCLEKSLQLLSATGLHEIHDEREAARMLIGMVIGDMHYDRLIGVGPVPSKSAIKRRIERAIKIFLGGTRIDRVGSAESRSSDIDLPAIG